MYALVPDARLLTSVVNSVSLTGPRVFRNTCWVAKSPCLLEGTHVNEIESCPAVAARLWGIARERTFTSSLATTTPSAVWSLTVDFSSLANPRSGSQPVRVTLPVVPKLSVSSAESHESEWLSASSTFNLNRDGSFGARLTALTATVCPALIISGLALSAPRMDGSGVERGTAVGTIGVGVGGETLLTGSAFPHLQVPCCRNGRKYGRPHAVYQEVSGNWTPGLSSTCSFRLIERSSRMTTGVVTIGGLVVSMSLCRPMSLTTTLWSK